MQALIKKNKTFRKEFKNLELNYFINSALTKNNILVQSDKNKLELFIYKNKNKPKISKIRNLCVLTGRSRALIQNYKISRLKFKDLAETGYIPGVKKK